MGDLPDLANLEYASRVNRAIDHVTRYLDQPLDLDAVSRVAAFSPFHFHRIFRAMMGETLHEFVKRTRLERALYLMSHTERSLTEVALEVGFSSSSDFSRSFKAHFGVPPRAFDLAQWRQAGLARLPQQDIASERRSPSDDGFTVTVRTLKPRRVAYTRVFQPFEPGRVQRAAAQLVDWARARGLEGGQWLGSMWDEPELVPLEKCRYDVGLEVPDEAMLDAPFLNEQRYAEMTVAELDFAGSIEREVRAFEFLYGTWLPRSGREPAHLPCFEAWNGLPFAHGDAHFDLRLHLPLAD